MISFAHVVNPVMVGKASDLYTAQPVTFESMRLAQAFSRGNEVIELLSAQFAEDVGVVPEWMAKTEDLYRSILDFGNFRKNRKLPLLGDILDRLYKSSQADYFIYTNVDIALMPHFYTAVSHLIKSGADAMVINRRTIAKTPSDPAQIPLMWAQVGEKHPGYDCFVFRRDAYPHFDLGTACIGANWIGRILLANIHAHAERFRIFEDLHLTFHLGDDQYWNNPLFADYEAHNENELLRILENLEQVGKMVGRDLLNQFLQFHQMRLRQPDLNKIVNGSRRRPWWKLGGK